MIPARFSRYEPASEDRFIFCFHAGSGRIKAEPAKDAVLLYIQRGGAQVHAKWATLEITAVGATLRPRSMPFCL